MSTTPDATGAAGDPDTELARDDAPSHEERQPVVRVRGARRARLLPAPGTTAEPAPADDPHRGGAPGPVASGPNDDRMLRDVPPHY